MNGENKVPERSRQNVMKGEKYDISIYPHVWRGFQLQTWSGGQSKPMKFQETPESPYLPKIAPGIKHSTFSEVRFHHRNGLLSRNGVRLHFGTEAGALSSWCVESVSLSNYAIKAWSINFWYISTFSNMFTPDMQCEGILYICVYIYTYIWCDMMCIYIVCITHYQYLHDLHLAGHQKVANLSASHRCRTIIPQGMRNLWVAGIRSKTQKSGQEKVQVGEIVYRKYISIYLFVYIYIYM